MGEKLPMFVGKLDAPGPGMYQPTNYALPRVQSISFGKEIQRVPEKKPNDNPAPNAYLPNVELVKEHFPEVKIGTADQRPKPANMHNPSPGEYDIRTVFEDNLKEKKGPSLSSRYQELQILNENPGPGDYRPNHNPVKIRPQSCK